MSKTNYATTEPPCTVHQCLNCGWMIPEPTYPKSQLVAIIEQVIGADEDPKMRWVSSTARNELRKEQRERLRALLEDH
jgi:hypothetical protein